MDEAAPTEPEEEVVESNTETLYVADTSGGGSRVLERPDHDTAVVRHSSQQQASQPRIGQLPLQHTSVDSLMLCIGKAVQIVGDGDSEQDHLAPGPRVKSTDCDQAGRLTHD